MKLPNGQLTRPIALLCTMVICCVAYGTPPSCPTPDALNAHESPPHLLDRPTRINVLIDGSGSMAGYFASPQSGNHYRDLLRQLRGVLEQLAGSPEKVTFSRFGEKLSPLAMDAEATTTSVKFYSHNCASAAHGGCDIDHSVIGHPLEFAEQRPHNELTLVLTDLFLTENEAELEGVGSLKKPLTQVLKAGGRAVGLLGFKTAFQGTIYDLPIQPSRYDHRPRATHTTPTTRPVFVLMIGRARHILDLYESLREPFLDDLREDQKFAFYGADWSDDAQSLTWSVGDGVLEDRRRTGHGLPAYRVLTRRYQPLIAEVSDDTFRARYGTSFEHWITRDTLWMGRGKPGCESWEKFEGAPPLVAAEAVGSTLHVSVFSDPKQLKRLPEEYFYALTTEIVANDARSAQPAGALQAWNLDPDAVPTTVRARPAFFPALNLKSVTDVLEHASQRTYHPIVLARATVFFSVEK